MPRQKRNSSKVYLTISVIFHTLLIGSLFFLAAREGMLGKRFKEFTVTLAPKEKKPEPPKAKPVEPKVEPPKTVEAAKPVVEPPPAKVETAAAPPPITTEAPPVAAPPALVLPAMNFSDGAKEVQTTTDPNQLYKSLVEYVLRSHWNRPDDVQDDAYVAEVEVSVNGDGRLAETRWVSGSGNPRWDDSVKQAIAATKTINRPPPKGFPGQFLVRFDVATEKTEPVVQLSRR